MRDVRVGIFPIAGAGLGDVAGRRVALARASEEGIDHVTAVIMSACSWAPVRTG